MSSQSDYLASLAMAQTSLFKFGGPILMSLGTVSCILNLAVFTRKNLRKNPCSIYFIAFNVCNFLLIYTSLISSTLAYGYKIDPTMYNLTFCRVRFYALFLFDVLSPSYLVFASIDRALLTSRNALTRQRSTPRLAFICITCVAVFWLSFHSHVFVLMIFVQFAPGVKVCYFHPGIYNMLVGYYSLTVKGILVPVLMLIFGMWAIRNVRGLGRVAAAPPPVTGTATTTHNVAGTAGLRSTHSKDRQLLRILLLDIGVYVMFNMFPAAVILYQQITQNQSQTLVQAQMQIFLLVVATFSGYVPPCLGCYMNFWVSKTFRQEIKNVFLCK